MTTSTPATPSLVDSVSQDESADVRASSAFPAKLPEIVVPDLPDAKAYAAGLGQRHNAVKDLDPQRRKAKEMADADGKNAAKAEKRPTSWKLTRYALENYTLGCDEAGMTYAVPAVGPRVIIPIRGRLRSKLASVAPTIAGVIASQSALSDTLAALDGVAADMPKTDPALRLAKHDGAHIIDMGDTSGAVVEISEDGWGINPHSPVPFRRTGPMMPMEVASTGDLTRFRKFVNVPADEWPLLVAWMVSAVFSDVQTPALLLRGEQGTGKTTLAEMLVTILDASNAPISGYTRKMDDWLTVASASQVVALDNLSWIDRDMSDSLCRAVTGDAQKKRAQYTNNELFTVKFKRAMIFTSIDPGMLHGDLADRMLPLQLHRISARDRQNDSTMWEHFQLELPTLRAGLYSVVVEVLNAMQDARPPELPRMGDFGRILWVVDEIIGNVDHDADGNITKHYGFDRYMELADESSANIVADSPFTNAIMDILTDAKGGKWEGSAAALLEVIRERVSMASEKGRGFPQQPGQVVGALTRFAPALRAVGVQFTDLGLDSYTRRRSVRLELGVDKDEDSSPSEPPMSVVNGLAPVTGEES